MNNFTGNNLIKKMDPVEEAKKNEEGKETNEDKETRLHNNWAELPPFEKKFVKDIINLMGNVFEKDWKKRTDGFGSVSNMLDAMVSLRQLLPSAEFLIEHRETIFKD